MDPADIPLPDSPVMEAVPAVNISSGLSSGNQAPTQGFPRGIFAVCRRGATAVRDLIAPEPVRQDWLIMFAVMHTKFYTYPAPHRYGFIALIISIAIAEWQLPGCCFPRPEHVTNAIIGFSCAALFVCSLLALAHFFETHKWPWQQDGWVWPWQKWLWKGTAYDLGASTSTLASEMRSPLALGTPSIFVPRPVSSSSTPMSTPLDTTPHVSNGTPTNFTFSMAPPTTFNKRPIIIPPTPQLPGGLRPLQIPPATPAEIHKSGILGESPMPPLKFKYFSGEGFERRKNDLQAIAEWHRSVNEPLRLTGWDVIPEKRGGEEVGGRAEKRREVGE